MFSTPVRLVGGLLGAGDRRLRAGDLTGRLDEGLGHVLAIRGRADRAEVIGQIDPADDARGALAADDLRALAQRRHPGGGEGVQVEVKADEEKDDDGHADEPTPLYDSVHLTMWEREFGERA